MEEFSIVANCTLPPDFMPEARHGATVPLLVPTKMISMLRPYTWATTPAKTKLDGPGAVDAQIRARGANMPPPVRRRVVI